jgi:chaperone modulatory protein CbpM
VAARPDEAVWLSEHEAFPLAELAELSGLSEAEIRELVEYGAIAPVDPAAPQWAFTGDCLVTVRTACRLRVSFDLEPHELALVISLLDRIRGLEAEMAAFRAQQPQMGRRKRNE